MTRRLGGITSGETNVGRLGRMVIARLFFDGSS
jgi:hypothetical protein